jgi:hypothetical protein
LLDIHFGIAAGAGLIIIDCKTKDEEEQVNHSECFAD